ncbi:hypothetical protein [Oceanimonas marisflavi]|uniref:hypothetical protein n=1 Tax=Oceanimonas marisflavi TaxID=2059724 RepID=UPI001300518E|nr:hypothetical protein [Oceanimonas marisflavi]
MISESTFSKKFTSFWNETLPNSKNYIRLINGGLLDFEYEPFEPAERKNNTALVNVISFNLLRCLCNKEKKINEIDSAKYYQNPHFDTIIKKSLVYLSRFSYGEECELPLTSKEKNQIRELFRIMYIRYVAHGKQVTIDPDFDGCGFLNRSFGDLISNKTLVEIKSGERRFSVTDTRQVLIYLVLNHYSKKPNEIQKIELFNPRMGISFTESVDEFCLNLSALNSQELFSEVQKFIVNNSFIETYGT